MEKYIYDFSEGNHSMKSLLGGKGAKLAEMTQLGIPVPFGFTITSSICNFYYNNSTFPDELNQQIKEKLNLLQQKTAKKFGDKNAPLLLSVRSGASISMPGMMDTILNLGLNDEIVDTWARTTQNQRFVYDCYRRFLQMFAHSVLKIPPSVLRQNNRFYNKEDHALSTDELLEISQIYKKNIANHIDISQIQNPYIQLNKAIEAVIKSWNNSRAVSYRKSCNIDHSLGTAVNIQSMVFGNMGENSGTGVYFTRNPNTGEKKIYGEYLINGQGEDIVSGICTPSDISYLEQHMPKQFEQLFAIGVSLESHFKNIQDIEFTIQNGELFILQTRDGKQAAIASICIVVDMVDENIINREQALLRISKETLAKILSRKIDPNTKTKYHPLVYGLAASPGVAIGQVVFDTHKAHRWKQAGRNIILVRVETSPDDLIGIEAADGILTTRGGQTSHAAVIARGMSKCCIVGCGDININQTHQYFKVADHTVSEGTTITLDGTSGEVYLGEIPTVLPQLPEKVTTFIKWVNDYKKQ